MSGGAAQLKHVFVSYSTSDEARALDIVDKLEAAGLTCWIAVRDLAPGEDFSNQIHRNIKTAGAFVVIVSAHANASRFVRMETEIAFDCCPIYPVRIENVPPEGGLALFLRINQWTDAFGAYAEASVLRLSSHIMLGLSHGEIQQSPGDAFGAAQVRPAKPLTQAPAPEQPQALPLASSEAPPPAAPLEPSDQNMRAFVGPNDAWFAESWRKMSLTNSEASFNFPAFLLGPIYLAYRKMWLWMALALGFEVSASAALSIALAEERPFLLAFTIIALFAVAVFFGLYFNHIYRAFAKENIAAIALQHTDPSQLRDRLQLAGGTSIWAALAVLAASGIYTIAMSGVEEEIRNARSGYSAESSATDTATTADVDPNATETLAPPAQATDAVVDPLPASSSLRKVWIQNQCVHPVEVVLFTVNEYGSEQMTSATPVNGNTNGYAIDAYGSIALTGNSTILFYASSTDGSQLRWESNAVQPTTFRDQFVSYEMGIDTQGDFNLPLICPGE